MIKRALFENITVIGINELLGRWRGGKDFVLGPIYPDFYSQTFVRHCRNDRPVDDRPMVLNIGACDRIQEDAIWGGCIYNHFGHFVSEFVHRLLPIASELSDAPILFSVASNFSGPSRMVSDVLSYFGVLRRVRYVKNPIIVDRLHVQQQGENLYGTGPSQEYMAELSKLSFSSRKLPSIPRHTYYISRSRQQVKFLGESLIDDFYRNFGVEVVYPELLTIPEQVGIYTSAKGLIFSEGSALHGIQLTGRIEASIHVIIRRPDGFETNFGRFLKARSSQVSTGDHVLARIGVLTSAGNTASWFDAVLLHFNEFFLSEAKRLSFELERVLNWLSDVRSVFSHIITRDLLHWYRSHKHLAEFNSFESRLRIQKLVNSIDVLENRHKLELMRELDIFESTTLDWHHQFSLKVDIEDITRITTFDVDSMLDWTDYLLRGCSVMGRLNEGATGANSSRVGVGFPEEIHITLQQSSAVFETDPDTMLKAVAACAKIGARLTHGIAVDTESVRRIFRSPRLNSRKRFQVLLFLLSSGPISSDCLNHVLVICRILREMDDNQRVGDLSYLGFNLSRTPRRSTGLDQAMMERSVSFDLLTSLQEEFFQMRPSAATFLAASRFFQKAKCPDLSLRYGLAYFSVEHCTLSALHLCRTLIDCHDLPNARIVRSYLIEEFGENPGYMNAIGNDF